MGAYLVYLRKSRKDLELEQQTGRTDTLQRHRDLLLALAAERGYGVAAVFEEVVSGDTVAGRPQMQALLAAVETGAYDGVLVMEISRLARGSTRDQGLVAETFACSGTKIITPEKIYDPRDEADEEYFEFGLFLSRREYRAINRRLQRGRQISLQEGKYIAGRAPYGYTRQKLTGQKGWTLTPRLPEAQVVEGLFRGFADGSSTGALAACLNAGGTAAPGGGSWTASAVRDILKNPVYAGFLRWAHRPERKRMADGRPAVSRPVDQGAALRKGLHPPLVDEGLWRRVNETLQSRRAPISRGKHPANPLAGVLVCGLCGRKLVQLPGRNGKADLLRCPTAGCPTVGSNRDAVEAAMVEALERWLDFWQPEPVEETGALISAQQAQGQRTRLLRQQDRLCALLEQGVYDQGLFQRRFGALRQQLAETEELLAQLEQPKTKTPRARLSIGALYAGLQTADRNLLWKTVLHHGVYRKTAGGRWGKSNLSLELFVRITRP